MHVEEKRDGSRVLLSKYTEHPNAPRSNTSIRSEILLGVTELKPYEENKRKTVFTTVSHVKTVGFLPCFAEQISIRGLMDFITRLEAAAGGKKERR